MPATVSLSTLRSKVRQRLELEDSGYLQNGELTTYINASIATLYNAVVAAYGGDYFAKSQSISTVAGTEQYAVAADFMALIGVKLNYSGSQYPLRQATFDELGQASTVWTDISAPKYRLRGAYIVFTPIPNSVQSITVWYVPTPSVLSADGDTFDFVAGWDEFVVADVCAKVQVKQDSDPAAFLQSKAEYLAFIFANAPKRDAGEPAGVIDVTAPRLTHGWFLL